MLDAAWAAARTRDRPPVLLAGTSADGLDRVPAGRRLEPAGRARRPPRRAVDHGPPPGRSHGRDPDGLELVVRANVTLSDEPLPPGRPSYHGTVDQVADDLHATRRAGAHR